MMTKALRRKLNKFDFEKTYLDERPELDAVIKAFIDDLDPCYAEGCIIRETEAIECRSRDGFAPHSHNHGGYEKQYLTDLGSVSGSGIEIGNYTTELAGTQETEALDNFINYDATDAQKLILKSIPKEKQNYHDLTELGHAKIADAMDEYCNEWLRGDAIWYGFRAMYEGQRGAWHTVVFYSCANRSEYHGAFQGDTLHEVEIKFRNLKELEEKLEKNKADLENAF